MTMRGFDEDDFRETGRMIAESLVESADIDGLRARVAALCEQAATLPRLARLPVVIRVGDGSVDHET